MSLIGILRSLLVIASNHLKRPIEKIIDTLYIEQYIQ